MTTPDPAIWVDSEGWVRLHHPVTNGATAAPNNPDVLDGFLARGWEYTPAPAPGDLAPVIEVLSVAPGGAPTEVEVAAAGATATVVFHPFDPSVLTVAQVMEHVGSDPARAAQALAAETAEGGKSRTSLINQLTAIAGTSTGPEADNA